VATNVLRDADGNTDLIDEEPTDTATDMQDHEAGEES
jgi:hypothetical protein